MKNIDQELLMILIGIVYSFILVLIIVIGGNSITMNSIDNLVVLIGGIAIAIIPLAFLAYLAIIYLLFKKVYESFKGVGKGVVKVGDKYKNTNDNH